ncbi:mechanosensitive ion channel domain-containing protein [Fusobacterium sp.]|uniref:mechanosensitive ion channel family protein n=1 Tax=Fusobacterium sp. TaxID=68766 RepID=UPI0025C1E890|nr:mechanosensitive ion channel domain-containing protein [Fusobacterium sp.]
MSTVVAEFLNKLFLFLPTLIVRGIILVIIFSIWPKLVDVLITTYKKMLRRKNVDPLLESFTSSMLKTLLYIILFFLIIGIAGVKATSLITVLGTAGLAVGLALQGSLANLAGGLLILFFKPFTKDEYIVAGGGIEGTVDKIQILYTILTTVDNRVIIVPNSQLANNAITNVSRNPERRLDMVFSVSYDTSTDKVKEILNRIANEHPAVLKDKPVNIRMSVQNASSLDFIFRVWVKKENYWDAKFDFTEIVKAEFDANNIEIPYQKIDIYRK